MEEKEKQTATTDNAEKALSESNVIEEKKEKTKSPKKISIKVLIPIIIISVLIICAAVGTVLYFFVFRGNTQEDVLNDYCVAYNKQDVSSLEKGIYGSFDSAEFQKVIAYSINSFEVKSENSNYSVGEAVMTYTLKDGKTEKDTFTVYFKKDGRKWKLCSSIVFEERSNTFVKIQ